jgi:hypothetical protein
MKDSLNTLSGRDLETERNLSIPRGSVSRITSSNALKTPGQPGHYLFKPTFRLIYALFLTGGPPVTVPMKAYIRDVTGEYRTVTGAGFFVSGRGLLTLSAYLGISGPCLVSERGDRRFWGRRN